MALKLKTDSSQGLKKNNIVYEYRVLKGYIPMLPPINPHGLPYYSYVSMTPIHIPTPAPVEMPESNTPRALNYYADYGGCGFWRMVWPETVLNSLQRASIGGLTTMVLDLRFYQGLKAVRLQRQATPAQAQFVNELHRVKKEVGFKLLYEIDDVIFREDIPEYNRCREAFTDPAIVKSILDIMSKMDEISVTCDYMKEYYRHKTGNNNITVIPNYAPKSWLGRYYEPNRVARLYDQHKKRPRVLYSGSGTHVDVTNFTDSKDDFEHVVQAIIKARKKFKFVWKGCIPLPIKPFIENGDMEYIDWTILPHYPQSIYDAACNVTFASLQDNNFNRCKSNIKMVEAGAFGMPGAYQNLCTYKEAEFKFKSGSDLIDQLEYITSDVDRYMNLSKKSYEFTDKLWLEDHIDEYEALYFTDFGSKERNVKSPGLILNNPDQKI